MNLEEKIQLRNAQAVGYQRSLKIVLRRWRLTTYEDFFAFSMAFLRLFSRYMIITGAVVFCRLGIRGSSCGILVNRCCICGTRMDYRVSCGGECWMD